MTGCLTDWGPLKTQGGVGEVIAGKCEKMNWGNEKTT